MKNELAGQKVGAVGGVYVEVGAPVKVDTERDPVIYELLSKFHSVGCDCELGLVQRKFQVEQMGLLRWCTTQPEILTNMLHSKFEGIGGDEHTELSVAPWGEIFVKDNRYRLNCHTFIHERGVDKNDFLKKQRNRLKMLARMFIEDLEDAKKIFFYKSNVNVDLKNLDELNAAFKKFGPIKFAALTPGDPNSDVSITVVKDHFVIASMPRLGPVYVENGAYWDIDFPNWKEVCRKISDVLP